MTESCLVRGRWLVTAADEPVLSDAALLLEAGRVTSVGDWQDLRERYPDFAVFGGETAAISINQYPAHDHGGLAASSQPGSASNPAGGVPATTPTAATYGSGADEPMNAAAITSYAPGANSAHANVQPFLCVNFIICLFGIYP